MALGEQAALLHVTSGGRFTLGVGRGGPWVDLEVFGAGLAAYEQGFPESLDLLLRWLREPAVAAAGERYAFREVPVVPRPADALTDGPPGPGWWWRAPRRERAAGRGARAADAAGHARRGRGEGRDGRPVAARRARGGPAPEESRRGRPVSAGVVQLADSRGDAVETLLKAMPGWLQQGLEPM